MHVRQKAVSDKMSIDVKNWVFKCGQWTGPFIELLDVAGYFSFHSLFMALALRILSHSGLPVVVEESCIIIMILRLTWMTLSVLSYLVFHWMWPSKVTINSFKPQYQCAYSPHCSLYIFYGMLVQISRRYDFMLNLRWSYFHVFSWPVWLIRLYYR